MLSKLKDSIIENSSTIKNPHEHFLYLSAYPELIEYYESNQEKENFNEDDFIHLLLILRDKSEMMDKKQRKAIEGATKWKLIMYIKSLILSYPEVVPYYLLLLPPQDLADSYLSIFSNYSEFKKV